MVLVLNPHVVPMATTISLLAKLSHWRILQIAALRPFHCASWGMDVSDAQALIPQFNLHFLQFECGPKCGA